MRQRNYRTHIKSAWNLKKIFKPLLINLGLIKSNHKRDWTFNNDINLKSDPYSREELSLKIFFSKDFNTITVTTNNNRQWLHHIVLLVDSLLWEEDFIFFNSDFKITKFFVKINGISFEWSPAKVLMRILAINADDSIEEITISWVVSEQFFKHITSKAIIFEIID